MTGKCIILVAATCLGLLSACAGPLDLGAERYLITAKDNLINFNAPELVHGFREITRQIRRVENADVILTSNTYWPREGERPRAGTVVIKFNRKADLIPFNGHEVIGFFGNWRYPLAITKGPTAKMDTVLGPGTLAIFTYRPRRHSEREQCFVFHIEFMAEPAEITNKFIYGYYCDQIKITFTPETAKEIIGHLRQHSTASVR